MVFRGGSRDPCTWDVARLSESVKKHTSLRLCYCYYRRKRKLYDFSHALIRLKGPVKTVKVIHYYSSVSQDWITETADQF